MARLKKEYKLKIIRMLAGFSTSKEVQDYFMENHGLELSYNQISHYNPERVEGSELSRELRDLFQQERKRFLNHIDDLAYTHQAYRLRRLCEMAETYRRNREDQKEIRMILAIEKIMSEREVNNDLEADYEIRPTLEKINNYIYFDK